MKARAPGGLVGPASHQGFQQRAHALHAAVLASLGIASTPIGRSRVSRERMPFWMCPQCRATPAATEAISGSLTVRRCSQAASKLRAVSSWPSSSCRSRAMRGALVFLQREYLRAEHAALALCLDERRGEPAQGRGDHFQLADPHAGQLAHGIEVVALRTVDRGQERRELVEGAPDVPPHHQRAAARRSRRARPCLRPAASAPRAARSHARRSIAWSMAGRSGAARVTLTLREARRARPVRHSGQPGARAARPRGSSRDSISARPVAVGDADLQMPEARSMIRCAQASAADRRRWLSRR